LYQIIYSNVNVLKGSEESKIITI